MYRSFCSRSVSLCHSSRNRAFHVTARMALYQPPDSGKLIFAPGGSKNHGQAEQFTKGTLSLPELHPTSPIPQFHTWFSHAQDASSGVSHPETCALSTAELPSGRVSSRMVYLKELESKKEGDAEGAFVVYSNWDTSRKAKDLATNPYVALVFYWEPLQRQVRVEGKAKRMTSEESQVYYGTRARGSRLGAWASRQSAVLKPKPSAEGDGNGAKDDGRAQLEGWVKDVERKFEGQEKIPVPEFWGGLRVLPERVEFWQGRDSRLHDRFVYELDGESGKWKLMRLSP